MLQRKSMNKRVSMPNDNKRCGNESEKEDNRSTNRHSRCFPTSQYENQGKIVKPTSKKYKRLVILESDDEETDPNESSKLNNSIDVDSDESEENGTLPPFCWRNKDLDPIIHSFDATNSGCQTIIGSKQKPLEYFERFFSNELVSSIANQTNEHFHYLDRTSENKNSRSDEWYDTTMEEVYCFLVTTMLMSRRQKPCLDDFWSEDHLLDPEVLNELMTYDRCMDLLKYLYFTDPQVSKYDDKLFKIRAFVDKCRTSFQEVFYPYQNIFIEDSLLIFYEEYMSECYTSVPKWCGFKTVMVGDCKTGFIFDILFYSRLSKENVETQDDLEESGNIVMTSLESYLQKGHTFYLNKWCTSPALFDMLHANGTNAYGLVRKSRKHMPVMPEKLKRYEIAFRSTENLLCLKWKDCEYMYMLSTCHSADTEDTETIGNRVRPHGKQPACFKDYVRTMENVAKIEDIPSTLVAVERYCKDYKKYFFHILDICIWNAYVLYQHETGKKVKFYTFHSQLIKEICFKYLSANEMREKTDENRPCRLTKRHFPSSYLDTTGPKKSMRKCIVCTKHGKHQETQYYCRPCNVGLCIDPCFKIYHTVMDY